MASKPFRHGDSWTKTEEDLILACVTNGMTLSAIAEKQQRTTGGIRARLTRIACHLVEEKKMSVYEAAGRTGIQVRPIQEALKCKTDQAKARAVLPTPKMEFNFQQTFSRVKLQGRQEEMRKAAEEQRLWQIRQHVEQYVNQTERAVLDEAAAGKTFYLHEVRLPHDCTNDDILQGFRQKFLLCTVTLAEEWVDIGVPPGRTQPTRVLKSGIKIDWS
jgi:hypothetical protein